MFQLTENRKGYAYVDGFGAGGVGYAVSWPSPSGSYDLQVRVFWGIDDGGLDQTEETKNYNDTIRVRPLPLLEQVARSVDECLFGLSD